MSHDPRHEEWMAARLSGQPIPKDAGAQLDACAACRGLEADLIAVTRSLDRAAAHENAVVDRIARADRGESTASGATRPATVRSIPWQFAAAALILIGIVAWMRFAPERSSEPAEGPGPMLSGGVIRDLAPDGVVAEFTSFTFVATRPSGGEFKVRVYDPTSGALVLESPPLEDSRWNPTAEDRARIPRTFRWQVSVVDATGVELASRSSTVSVGPH